MVNPSNCGVYRWLNIVTGKSHVGSSSDIPARKRHSIKLQRSWNKHGAVAFEFEVLINCPEDDLLRQEQSAIDAFDAYRTGYVVLSEKHRRAIAASSTKSTEEAKQAMRAAWNSHTPEFKAWLVRKGAATRWGNPFSEPKPAPLETTICCA